MISLCVLFAIAGAFTAFWLGNAITYVTSSMGWGNLMSLPPSDLALFVLATTGPVAIVWLIAGYLLLTFGGQRQERTLLRLASLSRRGTEHMEAQVRILLQMHEAERRRRVENEIESVLRDLVCHCATIAERVGMITEADADALWARTHAGDAWAFANTFLSRDMTYKDFDILLAERLFRDSLASSSLQTFLYRYATLARTLHEADANPLLCDLIDDGPLNRLNVLFLRIQKHLNALSTPGTASTYPAPPPPPETSGPSVPEQSVPGRDVSGQDVAGQGGAGTPPPQSGQRSLPIDTAADNTGIFPSDFDIIKEENIAGDTGQMPVLNIPLTQETKTVTESLSRLQSALAQLNDLDVTGQQPVHTTDTPPDNPLSRPLPRQGDLLNTLRSEPPSQHREKT